MLKTLGVHFIRHPCLTRTVRVRPQHQKTGLCLFVIVEVWRGGGCRNAVVGVAASVHRQPLVPLRLCIDSHLCRCIVQRLCVAVFMHPCITALCGCLYASLHNDFVRPLSCIHCTFMNALPVSHPHYPTKNANALASLVKGRWLDGKAQALTLLHLLAICPPF